MKLNAITLSGVGEALTIPATGGGSLVHAHELIVLLPHQRNTTQRSLLLGVSIDRSMAWLTIVRDSWWCAPDCAVTSGGEGGGLVWDTQIRKGFASHIYLSCR
jgi:hypothetical protein